MKARRNKFLIYNWVFITGLVILILNDHYLKWEFSNWITGKLSDFVGLLIFPMFIHFLFPRLSIWTTLLTGLLFIFWKLPVSENFIYLYNRIAIIPIVRTVDYTNLIALSILPFSNFLIQRIEKFRINLPIRFPLNPAFIIIPSTFIFMATSPPISYYMKADGDINIGKTYRIKMSKEKVLGKLKEEGFSIRPIKLLPKSAFAVAWPTE